MSLKQSNVDMFIRKPASLFDVQLTLNGPFHTGSCSSLDLIWLD